MISYVLDEIHHVVADAEIGVITPYYAQSRKLRTLLQDFARGVKVGSVEEFQGQVSEPKCFQKLLCIIDIVMKERRVIVLSTVRSSRDLVTVDLKHTLGFVANPRRLNVAITRAQSLVIIVGDPSVLSLDPLWRALLNYIHMNGGWRGDPPTWDTSEPVRETGGYDDELREENERDMNEFSRKMEMMTRLGLDEEKDGDQESEDEENVDRPWRELE